MLIIRGNVTNINKVSKRFRYDTIDKHERRESMLMSSCNHGAKYITAFSLLLYARILEAK